MQKPFKGTYPITQKFGENPQDYAQFGMKGHNGIDYGMPTGTTVIAATSGIAYVKSDPPGFGVYIEVVGAQYKTVYAHLQRAAIANGHKVSQGEAIGYSNNTGNSSGPHLHFGVKPIAQDNNNGYFGAIDPQPILNGENDMLDKRQRDRLFTATIGYPPDANDNTAIGSTLDQALDFIENNSQYQSNHAKMFAETTYTSPSSGVTEDAKYWGLAYEERNTQLKEAEKQLSEMKCVNLSELKTAINKTIDELNK